MASGISQPGENTRVPCSWITHTCTHTHSHLYIYTHNCIYTYTCTFTSCTHTYYYTHIHIHTHSFFQSLRDLEYVNLSGNQLEAFPDPSVCPNLKHLLVHSNRLKVLPAFSNTDAISALDASCNCLTELPKVGESYISPLPNPPGSSFLSLPLQQEFRKLVFLDLSANPLVANSESISHLKYAL